jgi:hypothetical protein
MDPRSRTHEESPLSLPLWVRWGISNLCRAMSPWPELVDLSRQERPFVQKECEIAQSSNVPQLTLLIEAWCRTILEVSLAD